MYPALLAFRAQEWALHMAAVTHGSEVLQAAWETA